MKSCKKILNLILKYRNKYRIFFYKISGKRPWSYGYREFKWDEIKKVIDDKNIIEIFSNKKDLPEHYGQGLDERIIEYPWVLSQIPQEESSLMDAGSVFNYQAILDNPVLKNKKMTIVNLFPEHNCFYNFGISYLLADLRNLPYKNETFDIVTCISTLEHVGMNNEMLYNKSGKREDDSGTYIDSINELTRVTKKGGYLMITVPFGRYENHGFLQQFDKKMIGDISARFQNIEITYYKYTSSGWQTENNTEMMKSDSYFNIHEQKYITGPAAASSIACIKIQK